MLGKEIPVSEESEWKIIAAKLELFNEQLAKRKESRRKFWRRIFIIVLILVCGALLTELASFLHYYSVMETMHEDVSIIGGSDAPTDIIVSNISGRTIFIIATIIIAVIAVLGIYKTRKK